MKRSMTSDEVDTFMKQLKLLIAVIVVLFLIPLCVYAFYLDRRMGSFENSLRYRPPQETAEEHVVAAEDRSHVARNPVLGQLVYVPAYSHVYHGDGNPNLLTITLSVRNTSLSQDIAIKSVRYFDTKGREVKSYLGKPIRIAPLGSTEVLVGREDASGGSGASFLVEWLASTPVTEPIVEAVMIDTRSQQGISFVSRGTVISEVVSQPDSANGATSTAPASTPLTPSE